MSEKPPPPPPTAAEMNQTNSDFWAKQNKKISDQLNNAVLRNHAFNEVAKERKWGVPVYDQITIENQLEYSERFSADMIKHQNHKAATKPRPDQLQTLIIKIVEENHTITTGMLLNKLNHYVGCDIIYEIHDDEIEFFDKKGKNKFAPISGLKDRLSRAKRIINSR